MNIVVYVSSLRNCKLLLIWLLFHFLAFATFPLPYHIRLAMSYKKCIYDEYFIKYMSSNLWQFSFWIYAKMSLIRAVGLHPICEQICCTIQSFYSQYKIDFDFKWFVFSLKNFMKTPCSKVIYLESFHHSQQIWISMNNIIVIG